MTTTRTLHQSNQRLRAAGRRLIFEMVRSIGVFWLINYTHFGEIKEPWNTLYKRLKAKQYYSSKNKS